MIYCKRLALPYSFSLLIGPRSATSSTQTQLCGHARRMVDQINPKQDTAVVSNNIPKMLAAQTPKPLYYQNYTVGECRDLIFGVSLVDYATAKGLGEGEVPKIVKICIKEIDDRGLDAEGIYRVRALNVKWVRILTISDLGIWKTCICSRGMLMNMDKT